MWNKLLLGAGDTSSFASCSEYCVAVIDLKILNCLIIDWAKKRGKTYWSSCLCTVFSCEEN